jgi:hypothetical protein
MSTPFLKSFDRTISVARLGSYRKMGGTEAEVLARYLWNASLCEALHSSLQHLEVGFRNALHGALSRHTGNPNWISQENAVLQAQELEAVRAAKRVLMDRGKPTDEGYLVNELRFGFWASLLDSRYERLWPKIIVEVFPSCPRRDRSRNELSKIITKIRRLRNYAFHHHSIWHWGDLPDHHKDVHKVIGWICPSLAMVALLVDRFQEVYSAGSKMHLPKIEKLISPIPIMADSPKLAPHITLISSEQ